MPHPGHDGTTTVEVPPLPLGSVMALPSAVRGGSKEGAGAEIDFMMLKGRGKMRVGWVCYIMRESDGEVMDPEEFNLHVIISTDKGNPKDYKGGYKYFVLTTGESPSKMNSSYQITFDPYINISPTLQPGYYKIFLEVSEWPKKWSSRKVESSSKDFGNLKVIDRNYIRFRVIPAEEDNT
jgi:hypothetical protein